MPTSKDDRKNLPGCSELHRVVACPGYLAAKAAFPTQSGSQSTAASSGTKIHDALAEDSEEEYIIDGESVYLTLKGREQWLVDKSQEMVAKLVVDLWGTTPILAQMVEQRMFLRHQGEDVLAGKPDLCKANSNWDWLIVDYKTGSKPVPTAESNWQIHGYALCLESYVSTVEKLQLGGKIFGVIIQPLVSLKPTVVEIQPDTLKAARAMVLNALKIATSKLPNPRIPGAHCDYCQAAPTCFEAASTGIVMEKRAKDIASMSPEQVAQVYTMLTSIENRCDEVRQYVKRKLFADPGSIPGLKLVMENNGSEVQDKIAFLRSIMPTITKEEFTTLLKVPMGKIRELWVDRTVEAKGCTKTEAAAMFKDATEVATVPKPQKMVIRRDHGKPEQIP